MSDEFAYQDAVARLEDAKHAALVLFARRMTHDLNNSVAVIRTYTEMLLEDVMDPGARRDLREIHEAADGMVDYLRRVVRFSRMGNGKPSDFAVEAAVADAMEALQREDPELPVFVEGGTALVVRAEPRSFSDVVCELVRNAQEASPIGSPVVVHLGDHDERWVIVRVSDDGPGFHASVAEIAEDPFVTTKQGVRGAGFGLTLASAFARSAGGKIVREREDGRTHVSMWLPSV
jgi:signal transduction histidine kinase